MILHDPKFWQMVFQNAHPITKHYTQCQWRFRVSPEIKSKTLVHKVLKRNNEWVNVFYSTKTGRRVFHFPTKFKISFYVRDDNQDSMDKFAVKLIGSTKMEDVEKHLTLFLLMVAR